MFREILLKNSIDFGDFGLSVTDQLFIEVSKQFFQIQYLRYLLNFSVKFHETFAQILII